MPDDYNSDFDGLFQTAEPTLTRADVRQEVGKALADISQYAAQTSAGITHAIEEVSSQLPDFKERMPQMQAVLQEEPVLADAIRQAENNPGLQTYLAPLYKLTYRVSQTSGEKPSSAPTQQRLETSRPSDFTDETMYQGALASQRVNLSPENRKALIEKLEQAGIKDVEF